MPILLALTSGAQQERIVRPALPLQDTRTLLKLMQLDLDTDNYRKRVLHKLARELNFPKLTFQVIRRTKSWRFPTVAVH